jgi:hypothetical protein
VFGADLVCDLRAVKFAQRRQKFSLLPTHVSDQMLLDLFALEPKCRPEVLVPPQDPECQGFEDSGLAPKQCVVFENASFKLS